MAADNFENHSKGLDSPADRQYVVTPHDTTELDPKPRALKFLAAGNVAVEDAAGTIVVYPVGVGDLLQFRAKRVRSTNTTVAAGNIIAWY
jgi:hypothetical protein